MIQVRLSTLIGLLLVIAAPLPSRADWPKWRGPHGNGEWNPPSAPGDPSLHEPEMLWQIDIGGGYGGVTCAGNQIFLLDRIVDQPKAARGEERLLCVDRASGTRLWQHTWAADYGKMDYANGPRSSVTIHEGRVYALGATGIALCLNAADGSPVWQIDCVAQHQAGIPTWGFAASPVIDGDRVLLHVGAQPDGSVIALDRNTGKQVWGGGTDPAGYCTPEIITHRGRRQLIVWGPEHIQSLDPDNGRTFWTYPYKITYGVSIAQPAWIHDTLIVSGYWHGTKALKLGENPGNVSLLWEQETNMNGLMSGPIQRNGILYLLDKSTGLQAIDPSTGNILWSDTNTLTPKDRNPQMSLVWLHQSQGLAALLNASGELIYLRLEAEGFEELARHQVIGKTWAHPAFSDNHLFARSDTQLIAWRLWPD